MNLRYALMTVALIIIAVIATDVYLNTFGTNTSSPSNQLKREVGRTQNTARNLDKSYRDIMPPQPPGLNSPKRNGPAETATPVTEIETLPPGTYTNITAPAEPADPAAPPPVEEKVDKYAAYANPADAEAIDAVAFSRELRETLEAEENEYATEVAAFYDEWNQRYQLATEEHRRFQWRLAQADRVANEYFEMQANLTRQMPNAQRRDYYVVKDQEERELYLQWQLQAHDILGQSNIIMDELRQLNLEITKQTLSADFATLYQEFHSIPLAITNLHGELDLFRQRSEQLEQRFTRG